MFQFAKKPQKVPEFLRSNIFLGGFFVLAVFGFLVFFFPPFHRVSARIGVSEIGVYHENDPQKNFFSPRKSGRRALRARLPGRHR